MPEKEAVVYPRPRSEPTARKVTCGRRIAIHLAMIDRSPVRTLLARIEYLLSLHAICDPNDPASIVSIWVGQYRVLPYALPPRSSISRPSNVTRDRLAAPSHTSSLPDPSVRS